MKKDQPGLIIPDLWCLGRRESNVYLLRGSRESILISGGNSYILPDVLKQLESFGQTPERIDKCLILHAHFDHIGIIPYFKRTNPDLQVYASKRGWDILQKDKAIATINEFSLMTARRMRLEDSLQGYDWQLRDDLSGQTVSQGDSIDLGGLRLEILETPGHSSCSISAYAPEIKALFPSDAGGIPFQDEIIPSGNSNFSLYQQNLEKLAALDVEIYCADHYGYLTGQEASQFTKRSLEAAAKYRRLVEKVYEREQDMEKTVEHLVQMTLDTRPDYFLPRDILSGVSRQIVKHIAANSNLQRK
ncbi:MAG: MBL fold metallo-hydrolase [Desulfohalobiaceae bacterium]|nr:MBL fold metallo-hydrolase [Desulfohalobiaceae bacterium]